jgi:riboflavin synthase
MKKFNKYFMYAIFLSIFLSSSGSRAQGSLTDAWNDVKSLAGEGSASIQSLGTDGLKDWSEQISKLTPLMTELGFHLLTVKFHTSGIVVDSYITVAFNSDDKELTETAIAEARSHFKPSIINSSIIWTASQAKAMQASLGFRSVIVSVQVGRAHNVDFCLVNNIADGLVSCS